MEEFECERCHRPTTVPKRVKQEDGSVRILGSWCAWKERAEAANAAARTAE